MTILRNVLWTSVGLFGLAALVAMPVTADFVILDDLIVDGSACIGFDCVNGESFGFDTIRIKENNLRIKAEDTSSAASFPTQDWQITFNDSANGGANKFAIDAINPTSRTMFVIEADAQSNAIYATGSKVGFGTNNPVTEVHIVDGDTPTLRLEQDGSSGFAPQTWDVAGNETNFFVRDVSNGSTLPLRIRPGAPSSAIDIGATGNIGVGAASDADNKLLVKKSTGAVRLQVETGSASNSRAILMNSVNRWEFRNNTVGDFTILEDATNTALTIDDATLDVTLAGSLITGTVGSCTVGTPCDGVFRADEYTVESIDEHAAYMWQNEHLLGVGPTPAGTPINITRKTTGILNELEKAHIYIEQLHQRLVKLEAELTAKE